MLVTVGLDNQHRYQIVIWDIAKLIIDKIGSISQHICNNNNINSLSSTTVSTMGINILINPTSTSSSSSSLTSTSLSSIIAKQISEFPIHKIKFHPYNEFHLISCGKENIRFWRIRKGDVDVFIDYDIDDDDEIIQLLLLLPIPQLLLLLLKLLLVVVIVVVL
jgi:WD40 repeat protein